MSYTVHRLAAGRWAWVADCTADWMPTGDLLAEARVDAQAEGPGRYCVTQTSGCGSEVERHEFDIEPKPEPTTGPTVAEAKLMIEEAVNDLGGAAHERYAGLCRTDRNNMVCAVQSGRDVAKVCIAWLADEAGNEVADEEDESENCDEEDGGAPQSSVYGLLAMFEEANSGKEPVAFVELTAPPDGWRPLDRAEGLRRFEQYDYEDAASFFWPSETLRLMFPSWDGESEIAYLSKPDGPGCDQ